MKITVDSTHLKVKVEPLKANNLLIHTDEGTYLQSYSSIIAFKPRSSRHKIILDKKYWEYSATTGKHRNLFLGEGITETRQKIEDGEYLLSDLN